MPYFHGFYMSRKKWVVRRTIKVTCAATEALPRQRRRRPRRQVNRLVRRTLFIKNLSDFVILNH